ncbi:MAG TPA: hypothetical protein VIK33_06225 [Anaerolineae bacterium]
MTKSKASLKGKGIDILLGGATDSEPGAPAPRPVAPSASAAPNPFAEPAPSPAAESPVVTAADALSSEAASGQPSTSVTSSLPTEESIWGADQPSTITDSVPDVSAPSVAGPVSVPLPADPTLVKKPISGGLIMDFASAPPPEPFEPPTELTQTGLQVAGVSQPKMVAPESDVLRRIGEERIQALFKRIDDLYAQLAGGGISDNTHTSAALLYLRRARDKIMEDPRQFDEAEYLVNVAQYTVTRDVQVQRWSYTYGIVILIYGLIWFGVFSAGLILDQPLLSWLRTVVSVPATATRMADLFPAYGTVFAGGIGGILSLLYSLFKHIAKDRDFDRQFMMWYILQPFLGLIMGYIVHLFLVGIIFQAMSANSDVFKFIGALVAIAAAFRPHYVYGWLEWLLKSVRPGGREGTEEDQAKETASSQAVSLVPPPTPPSEPAGVG